MARAFILGAGASKFAGYPLGRELWAFVRDHSGGDVRAKERRQEVIGLIDDIIRKYVPSDKYDEPNLEEIFTYLDLTTLGTTLIQLGGTDWKQLRLKVMGMIADAFQWYQYKLRDELSGQSGIPDLLCRWTACLSEGDVLITFNWDLLHEAALWRVHKWHYSDGYGFRCEDAPRDARSSIQVLKLHGSVNWSQRNEWDCQPSVVHKADFFPSAFDDHEKTYLKGAGQWNEGCFLIIPSFLKDLSSNRLMLNLWNQAEDAIAHADTVIVIGYSLQRADAPSRQLFGSALLRNKKLSTVYYVRKDGSPDNWDEFCDSVGKYRKPVKGTFEDWLQNPILP